MGGAWIKTGRAEQGGNRGFLSHAEFHHQMALGFQQAGRLSRNGAIGGEAVGAAVERAAGIVADLRRKPRDVAAHDIGRIGHDQVERPRQRRAEIARHEMRARREARAAGRCRGP